MTDAMQMIREALEMALRNHNELMADADLPTGSPKLEAALTALDSLAVAPSEDIGELIDAIREDAPVYNGEYIEHHYAITPGQAAYLIQARDERIRREVCARLLGALESVPYSDRKREGASAYDDAIDVCLQTVDAKIAAILAPEVTDGQ